MLLEKLNKSIHQFTSYYQNIVSIHFQNKNVFVIEIIKTIREIKIIKTSTYKNSGNVFNEINSDFGLKDKKITTNYFPASGSYKLIEIPKMPQTEINPWIRDNASDFLPTGLTLNDIYLTHKIVRFNETLILLLGLFNKEEINVFFENLKITKGLPSTISPGLLNGVRLTKRENHETGIQNYYVENEDYHELVIIENEKLLYYNQIQKTFQSDNKVETINTLFKSDLQILDIEINSDNLKLVNPYYDDFEKEYSIAFILAKAELELLDTFDILPNEILLETDITSWKQIFIKLSLVAGISVFILYLLAFFMVFLVGSMKNGLEEEREILAPQLTQVDSLNSYKLTLQTDLKAARQVRQFRSNTSILFKMLSFHVPDKCWLTEINYNEESDKPFNTVSKGMSKEESTINEFLRNLESDNNIKNVKLDYISKLTRQEMFRDWKVKSSSYIEFQISLNY